MVSILHNGNSEGHWSLWKRQCYSMYQLFTGLR